MGGITLAQYRKILKATGVLALTAGSTWSCYQVYQTYCSVHKFVKTDVLELEKKRAEYIFMNDPIFKEKQGMVMIDEEEVERWTRDIFLFPIKWWHARQNSYAWRLMHLAQTGIRSDRIRAVRSLASLTDLNDWDYRQLAQVCDARTAVGLARSDGADLRFFLAPPYRHVPLNKEQLEDRFHSLLVTVNQDVNHECVKYFITKAFPKFYQRYLNWIDDHTPIDHPKQIIRDQDVLPMCVENLLHHSTVRDHARDIVTLGGLPFLMELARYFKNDRTVLIMLAKLMSNISLSENVLEDIFASGWLGLLATWSRHEDLTLSANASRALANLDAECATDGRFPRRIHLLHPTERRQVPPLMDVVFVHGLLGGAFVTWRQRDGVCPPSPTTSATPAPGVSHAATARYVEEVAKAQAEEWEELMSSYEAVLADCPEHSNGIACGPYTLVGSEADKIMRQGKSDTKAQTQCWPKYWLPEDCRYLRVIGINYDTNISSWSSTCRFDKLKRSIEERSDELIAKLKMAGLGSRPIVWVAHSMGGLIVKKMLVKAWESTDESSRRFVTNTKAVVFYSVPHVGSPVARLSPPTSLVLLPSVEVQELREKSPALIALHEKFLNMLEEHPLKIVSFAETKLTEVTTLRISFNFVPLDSADPGVGEFFAIPQDHLRICKPSSRQSFLYQKVLHLIKECLST